MRSVPRGPHPLSSKAVVLCKGKLSFTLYLAGVLSAPLIDHIGVWVALFAATAAGAPRRESEW